MQSETETLQTNSSNTQQAGDDFIQYISDLPWSHEFSDLIIHCSDGKIKAHCAIICCMSPILRRILMQNIIENEESYLHLPDIPMNDVKSLLSLLYTGNANVYQK